MTITIDIPSTRRAVSIDLVGGRAGPTGADGNIASAETYADLRALFASGADVSNGDSVLVYTAQKRGVFVYDSGDVLTADDGGTVIVDAINRRWKRVYSGAVHAEWWGLTHAALTSAAAAGDHVALGPYTFTISANTTLPGGKIYDLSQGPTLTSATASTLIFGAQINAPATQIFSGDLVVEGIRDVQPQWWGAAASGSGDDAPAIRKAIACMESVFYEDGGEIVLRLEGNFRIASTITLTPAFLSPMRIRGRGIVGTAARLIAATTGTWTDGVALQIAGTTPDGIAENPDWQMADFAVVAETGGSTATTGIRIGGGVGKWISGLHNNPHSNIHVGGFAKAWDIRNARQLRFNTCSGWADGVASGVGLVITLDDTTFAGDMKFESCAFIASSTGQAATLSHAAASPGDFNRITFDDVYFYGGASQMVEVSVTSTGNMEFENCAFDTPAGQSPDGLVVNLATGATMETLKIVRCYFGALNDLQSAIKIYNPSRQGTIVNVTIDGNRFANWWEGLAITGVNNLTLGTNTYLNCASSVAHVQLATCDGVVVEPQQFNRRGIVKTAVARATTANITLSGEQTIDGGLTSASRVLVKNQTTTSQNGIYVSGGGAWSRASDMNAWDEVPDADVYVTSGTVNGATEWLCTSVAGGTLGTTAITWVNWTGYRAPYGIKFAADCAKIVCAGDHAVAGTPLSIGKVLDETAQLPYSVTNFIGLDPTYATDSYAAFEAARAGIDIDSAYRRGFLAIPAGRYKLNTTLAFDRAATDPILSIDLHGETDSFGAPTTTLDFSGCAAGSDGIVFGNGGQFACRNLMVTGAPKRNIAVNMATSLGSTDYARYGLLENLRLQNAGEAGLAMRNTYMLTLRNIWSRVNGTDGLLWDGFHTSNDVSTVFADDNGEAGLNINGVTYSKFSGCGGDNNKYGWQLGHLSSVVFAGCGAESNDRDAVLIRPSSSNETGVPASSRGFYANEFIAFYAYANGLSASNTYANGINALTADSYGIEFAVRGFRSIVNNAADKAFILNGASWTIDATLDNWVSDGTNPWTKTGTVYLKNEKVRGKQTLLSKSSNQSFANGVQATATWDASPAVNDLGSVTSTTGITIGNNVNKIRVAFGINWASAAVVGTSRVALLFKNGSAVRGFPYHQWSAQGQSQQGVASATIDVVAGDVISLDLIQGDGGALDLVGNSRTFLSVEAVA